MNTPLNVQKLACPNCGAPVAVPAGVGQLDCPYCGSRLNIHRSDQPAAQPPAPAAPEAVRAPLPMPAAQAKPWYRTFIWMALLFIVFPPAWALVILLDKQQQRGWKIAAALLLIWIAAAILIQRFAG